MCQVYNFRKDESYVEVRIPVVSIVDAENILADFQENNIAYEKEYIGEVPDFASVSVNRIAAHANEIYYNGKCVKHREKPTEYVVDIFNLKCNDFKTIIFNDKTKVLTLETLNYEHI